jgi:hypothetical protein
MTQVSRSWLRSTPVSDEEFVERIRRQLEQRRRWGKWLVGLFGALLVGAAWLALQMANRAAGLAANGLGNRWVAFSGFGIGLALGLIAGLACHSILISLMNALSEPRTEQLLLRYHDALEELTGNAPELVEDSRGDA